MVLSAKVVSLALVLLCYTGQAPRTGQATARLEFRLAEMEPAEGLEEAAIEKTGEKVYLHKEIIINNEDIGEARAVESSWSRDFEIEIVFSNRGAEKMARISLANTGKRLAIIVDGKVISAPFLRGQIADKAQISGAFTKEAAEELASKIKSK
ncbi:MAG: hypothetical protein DMF60_18750 [Acidobacteria bacterium]|nr:MAG: hypothetical protein DMF60_18750 [Acidobacteriota bacterium]